MTIQEIFSKHIPILRNLSPTADMDIEILLSYALKKNKTYILAHKEYELSDTELNIYNEYFEKRCDHMPVALIVGKKEFYGLEFIITKYTFIPRPETELIIEEGLHFLNKLQEKIEITVLDIGTGSGCIPITLAANFTKADYFACDISEKALTTATQNAKNNNVNVHFLQSDLFSNITGTYNLITANLPYVPVEIYNNNKFLHHEPKNAITDDDDGLLYIKRVLDNIEHYLKPGGLALFEMHFTQLNEMKEYIQQCGLTFDGVIEDIQGFPRIVKVKSRT